MNYNPFSFVYQIGDCTLICRFSSIFIDALDPFFAVLILYGLTNFGMYVINSTYGCKDGLQTTTKQLWKLL